MMRAMSYYYYNPSYILKFSDQSSLNNVLTTTTKEKGHYIIVPQTWFNRYVSIETLEDDNEDMNDDEDENEENNIYNIYDLEREDKYENNNENENKKKIKVTDKDKGNFLIHLAGLPDKAGIAKIMRSKVMNDIKSYTSKTNKELREEVLEYYNRPKNQQLKIFLQ